MPSLFPAVTWAASAALLFALRNLEFGARISYRELDAIQRLEALY
jgi:hypothetical protein